MRPKSIAVRASFVALFLVVFALPASAQMGGFALQDVASTRLQRQLGTYISEICPDLQGPGSPSRVDLGERCRDLVQTANEITGSGPTTFSLGLNKGQLNEAVDDIAHRQLPANAKSSSEIAAVHTAAVSARLFALRHEETPDVMLAGTLLDSQGNAMPIAYQWSRDDAAAGARDFLPEGLGIYLNGNGAFGHRSSSNEELGFDFRNLGFTLGSDYRVTDSSIVGAAATYVNASEDFNRDKGKIDVNIAALSLYGSQRIQQLYVNGIATYAHAEIDLEREIDFIDRTAKGDTSSDEFSFGFGSGYEFQWEGLTYGPMMDWEWTWLDVRSFDESGAKGLNLSHSHDSMKSATVDLGLEGSHPVSTSIGVFIPQLSAAWVHQFEDDARDIRARYEFDDTGAGAGEFFVRTKSPDRNYAKVSAAVSGSFKRGVSGFVSYQAIVGHDRLSSHAFNFGGRLSF